MSVTDFLDQLHQVQIRLYVEGGKLRYQAPAGSLSDSMRQYIALHRAEIIAHLAGITAPHPVRACLCPRTAWRDAPPESGRIRTTCGDCGRFIGYRPSESTRK